MILCQYFKFYIYNKYIYTPSNPALITEFYNFNNPSSTMMLTKIYLNIFKMFVDLFYQRWNLKWKNLSRHLNLLKPGLN